MLNRKAKFLVWFLALIVVMACVPTLNASPTVPTLDPGAINKIIEQTANAASAQTARALPTSTPTKTETSTPKPRVTKTLEPTVTETLIYVYETPTAFVIPTITKTFSPTSNKNYACTLLDSPKNREIYNPRVDFNVRWRARNVGRQVWDRTAVEFIYDNGDKFHLVDGYDLSRTTLIGEVADLFVEMRAPKDPGTYTTTWVLLAGTERFCNMKLTIIVKAP
jgi:hypothetical protein